MPRATRKKPKPAEAPVAEPEPTLPREAETPAGLSGAGVESASFPIVGLGASAGGLEAYRELLQALPGDTGMAFVLVQHLDPTHASMLADLLARATTMPVTEVQSEPAVEPNHVYVIPPNRSMIIAGSHLKLLPRAEPRGQHRPIDSFLEALAEDQGHRAVGVILSGTGTDGTLGLEAIKAGGGITFAQDQTAQHDGMPRSAIASGCVDFTLAPKRIAEELTRIGRHPYVARSGVPADSGEPAESRSESAVNKVLRLLHDATGTDFTHYKSTTLYRRITRRMLLHKLEGLPEYLRFLQGNASEVKTLFHDILISVTSFFRDPDAFEVLKTEVFPQLLRDRSQQDPVRLWVLGCATGEEAYSLAIVLAEVAGMQAVDVPLQVFATDLNEEGLGKARSGFYPKTISEDVSPERLRRFFVEAEGSYQITKAIRDMCVFARQNVLTDPPFSRMDLISCRNLLIYMEPVLQQRILPLFHYALKPGGFLWLGNSESIGTFSHLFRSADSKHRIYAKKQGPAPAIGLPLAAPAWACETDKPRRLTGEGDGGGGDVLREADRLALAKYAPPGVLVNAELDILQFRGDTSPYLAPAPGKPSVNVLKMAREGLLVGLRAAMERASKEGISVRQEGLHVKSNGGWREVDLEVLSVRAGGRSERCFLIQFEDPKPKPTGEGLAAPGGESVPGRMEDVERQNARLTQELAATRQYMQSLVEQQEAANEELQSSNEEIQSSNEELQSLNEELQTSKEEIQSSNEELTTVNEELKVRNDELNQLTNDLANLLASVQMPIVMLGSDLRVRRFTPAAERVLHLIAADVGRPIGDIKLALDVPDLKSLLAEVIDTASDREKEVRDLEGHWYALHLRPYRTLDNRIDGAVMVMVDLDPQKRMQASIQEARAYAESIVATVREPLLVLDAGLRVRTASQSFYRTFATTPEEVEGRLIYEIGNRDWDLPLLRQFLEEVLPRESHFDDFTVEHDFERIGRRVMLLNGRRLLQENADAALILLAIEDITTRTLMQNMLRLSDTRLAALVESSNDAIFSQSPDGIIKTWNASAERLFGYTAREAVGRPISIISPPDRVEEQRRLLDRVRAGERIEHFDTLRMRSDGQTIQVSLSISPIMDSAGRVVGVSKVARDITERKRLEDELRQYAADLSEADHRKDRFLALLAHELRNPLASISNAVKILQLPESDGQSVQSTADMMARQVGQVIRLVDDLLDVNRITLGKIELRTEKIDVASVVNHAVEAARALVESLDHQLTVTVPPEPLHVNADPVRLTQVLGNLLNNACKFTHKGGRIWLTVEREGKQAVLRVRDTGIGIAAGDISRIFSMFTQVDTSLERSVSGLGIGLTLVKSLVEMHEGTVEVDSGGVGQGSEFVVRLPILVETPGPPPPEPTVSKPHPTTTFRILVVDDNRDSAESLAMLLRRTGNDAHIAYDGLEALEAAERFRPEVVLLDLGLPRLNGYEAAIRIREQPWSKGMVLVALTGWGQDAYRKKSREAGFDHHMVKPVDHSALMNLLAELPPTSV